MSTPNSPSVREPLPRWKYDAPQCEWVREDGQRVADEEIAAIAGPDLPSFLQEPRIWADAALVKRGTL